MTGDGPVSGRSARITHLDALRGALMLLGVVIHSAFVFITEERWLLASSAVSPVFDYLVLSIHVFRMPAFYLLSGFIFALVLVRSSSIPFMRSRCERILIPLFTAGLILNLFQMELFEVFGDGEGDYSVNPNTCDSLQRVFAGCWKIHLWFLVVLFYYFLIGWPVVRLLQRFPVLPLYGPGSVRWVVTIAFLVVFTQVVFTLSYRGFFDFIYYLPLLSDPKFFQYLPFFFLGVFLKFSSDGLEKWTQFGWFALIVFIASWVVFLWGFNHEEYSISEYVRGGRYQLWLSYALALQTAGFLIVLASRLPTISPARAAYISDASYTIYLVHHVMVFVFAVWLTTSNLPVGVQFASILVSASLVSWVVHHYLVRTNRFGSLIMNGRY